MLFGHETFYYYETAYEQYDMKSTEWYEQYGIFGKVICQCHEPFNSDFM